MGKSKNFSILLFIALAVSTLFAGCGNNVNELEGEGTVFDTVPIFEKDTFLYPISMRSSSYRFPENNFGDINLIDGNEATTWQTLQGLITGEFVEFEFDSLFISYFNVKSEKNLRYGSVKNILVYADQKLIGSYPLNTSIVIGRKVNTLRIELGETDGMNTVEVPFEIDSSSAIRPDKLNYETVYTSKSAAINEIVFYGENNKRYALRSVPVKKAKLNFYGVNPPAQLHNARLMFDGKKNFGWEGPETGDEKILLFSFDEDQIIHAIYFPFTENLNITKFGFRLRKRVLPEYTIEKKGNSGIFLQLKNTLKGKNFELVILETQNKEKPSIPEMMFHDGSRMFSIYSDSLEFFHRQLIDSSKNTTLALYLDNRIKATRSYTEFRLPLRETFSKTKPLSDSLPTRTVTTESLFRLGSNGTFIIQETQNIQTLGTMPETTIRVRYAEGYWMLKSKAAEQSQVVFYSVLTEKTSRIVPGKEPYETVKKESAVFESTLLPKYISFDKYFEGLTCGY